MSYVIYFIASINLLYNCDYRSNLNVEAEELQDNLETFVRPIKKLTGIFPNHEIEVQFRHYPEATKQRRRMNKKFPYQQILRTNNISTPSAPSNTSRLPTTPSWEDPDNQIVYMKDLKKALEDYEKKHNTMKCNQLPSPNELAPPALGNANGLKLFDIINALKKSGQMYKGIPKPSDEELSWLKIQVPA